MKKKQILDDDNIKRILFKLSFPATIGMIVMALYNLVDTIFIGRSVGPFGIAGLAIVFPLQMFVMAIAQMLGIGSASIISRSLGAKNIAKAKRTFSNVYLASILFSLLIVIPGFIFSSSILKIFGATDNILPFAQDYFGIIIFGTFFFSIDMISNNIIRSEGHAKVAMFSMFTGAILNIILDPIFIFGLHMGIKGAAFATVLSQFSMMIYVFFFFGSGKSILHLRDLYPIIQFDLIKEIIAVGSASFIRMVLGSALVVIVNNSLRFYGGDIAIAAYGIISRLIRFIFMPIFGIAQGLQPVLGYNFGAKRFKKAKLSILIAMKNASLITFVGFGAVMLFSRTFISIFTNDPELLDMGESALRLTVIALPLVGFQVIGSTIFQSIGKPMPALILTMTRQLIFLVPALLIIPRFIGLNGIWLASPISDTLSAFLSVFFVLRIYKTYRSVL